MQKSSSRIRTINRAKAKLAAAEIEARMKEPRSFPTVCSGVCHFSTRLGAASIAASSTGTGEPRAPKGAPKGVSGGVELRVELASPP